MLNNDFDINNSINSNKLVTRIIKSECGVEIRRKCQNLYHLSFHNNV